MTNPPKKRGATRLRHQAAELNPGDVSPRDPISHQKRKRGAQNGNTNARGHGAPRKNRNAVKHGYYSRLLSPAEKASLTRETVGWLDDEEIILRYLGGAIFERLKSEADLPLEKYIAAVRAIVLASGRIESFHRARRLVYPRLVRLRASPLLRQLESENPNASVSLNSLSRRIAEIFPISSSEHEDE